MPPTTPLARLDTTRPSRALDRPRADAGPAHGRRRSMSIADDIRPASTLADDRLGQRRRGRPARPGPRADHLRRAAPRGRGDRRRPRRARRHRRRPCRHPLLDVPGMGARRPRRAAGRRHRRAGLPHQLAIRNAPTCSSTPDCTRRVRRERRAGGKARPRSRPAPALEHVIVLDGHADGALTLEGLRELAGPPPPATRRRRRPRDDRLHVGDDRAAEGLRAQPRQRAGSRRRQHRPARARRRPGP